MKAVTFYAAEHHQPTTLGQYVVIAHHDAKELPARELVALYGAGGWITAPGWHVHEWRSERPQFKRNSYSEDEDLALLKNDGKRDAKEMAEHLGRSESSVKVRACILGVSLAAKGRAYNAWGGADERYVVELTNAGFTPQDIADKLDRSRASVYSKIEALRKVGVLPRGKE